MGLAFVLMLRPFFPELVMSTDLLSLEHPSVLLFCFICILYDIVLPNKYLSMILMYVSSQTVPESAIEDDDTKNKK